MPKSCLIILTQEIRNENKAMKDKEWSEFTQKLGNNPPSTKPFWKRISTIRGKKSNSSIPTLNVDKQLYESDEQKANLFSSILSKTFSMDNDSKFNNAFKIKVEKVVKEFKLMKNHNKNKYLFDLNDLNMVIKKLNIKSACGEDKIHNLMLKNSTQDFRKIILNLINASVTQSKIPQKWKNSLISMIPKKNNNSRNPKDYRPISLTSCMAKLAERLMLIKIKEFLD